MRGLNRSIAALLALLLILCIAVPEMADAAALRQGSSGERVKTLQSKLKRWGYYNGNVDGIFGSGTAQAVKYFQKKNGLTADGIVGEATAKALGLSLTGSSGGGSSSSGESSNSGDKDLYLLAKLVHGESRGEPYKGKVAVAAGGAEPGKKLILSQQHIRRDIPEGRFLRRLGRTDKPFP